MSPEAIGPTEQWPNTLRRVQTISLQAANSYTSPCPSPFPFPIATSCPACIRMLEFVMRYALITLHQSQMRVCLGCASVRMCVPVFALFMHTKQTPEHAQPPLQSMGRGNLRLPPPWQAFSIICTHHSEWKTLWLFKHWTAL